MNSHKTKFRAPLSRYEHNEMRKSTRVTHWKHFVKNKHGFSAVLGGKKHHMETKSAPCQRSASARAA